MTFCVRLPSRIHAAWLPQSNYLVYTAQLTKLNHNGCGNKAASSSESSLFLPSIEGISRQKCLAFHLRIRQRHQRAITWKRRNSLVTRIQPEKLTR